jgi:hypothetical protein
MTNLFKKGFFFLLALTVSVACSDDDGDDGGGGESGTITNVDFVITSENDGGNAVGVAPSSTGGTSYSVDFGDPAATNDSDVMSSAGPKVTYTYPEASASYDVVVTASAANATSVSATKSHSIVFESATVLANFEDAAMINLRDDKGGAVLTSITSQTGMDGAASSVGVAEYLGTGNWDAFSINPTNYINPKNKGVITLEYYQSEGLSREVLLKLEGTKTAQDGIFDIEVLVTSTNVSGWQTLTFDFKENAVGSHPNGTLDVILDEYQTMSLFVDFGTPIPGTYWFDNIEGAEWGIAIADTDNDGTIDSVDNCPDVASSEFNGCPIVSGPSNPATTPTLAEEDVISVFSNAYTDIAGTNFNPSWGQAGTYAAETIGSDDVIKYGNIDYQGIEYGTTDVSGMTNLHMDIYTADQGSIDIFLIDDTGEVSVTKTLTADQWTSIDILLSEFAGRDLTKVFQFKFVGSGGTIWVDNIYFNK